jgi:hypothetical protein
MPQPHLVNFMILIAVCWNLQKEVVVCLPTGEKINKPASSVTEEGTLYYILS